MGIRAMEDAVDDWDTLRDRGAMDVHRRILRSRRLQPQYSLFFLFFFLETM